MLFIRNDSGGSVGPRNFWIISATAFFRGGVASVAAADAADDDDDDDDDDDEVAVASGIAVAVEFPGAVPICFDQGLTLL